MAEVVVPDERKCKIPNMPVFQVGFWNGIYHSPAMLEQMAENFRRLNYRPFGSVNHHDILASGIVKGVRFDGRTLFLDLGSIPESIAKAWNADLLHGPSIEYWDTIGDERARLMSGLRLPDGSPPGLVLRAVTLCGNQAPAVKTLGPMPKAVYEENESYTVPSTLVPKFEVPRRSEAEVATFRDLCPATRLFSSEDFMDKAAMIAALKAADPTLTDAVLAMFSDQQLAALLNAKQAGSVANTVNDATPGVGAGAGGPPLDPSAMMAECGGDPVKMGDMVKKFMDAATKNWQESEAALTRARKTEGTFKALLDDAAKKGTGLVNDKIKIFMDGSANRIPPAQKAFVESSLRRCDAVCVRKFSDGSAVGSELDEEMAKVLKAFPVNSGFVRKFSDVSVNNASPDGTDQSNRIAGAIHLCSLIPEMKIHGDNIAKQFANAG